ncbi:6489_t:CDS:2, partial [Dentiscutata erythropus]
MSITPNVIEKLHEMVNYYHYHCNFKDQQNYFYKQSIEHTTTSSCVIVMDFKENIRIGGGPIETGNNFFEKIQVSVLGFAVCYREPDQSLHTQYFDYFSDILNHDSSFVIDCITKLLNHPFMSRFQEACFWADLCQGKIYLNYFTEYHGKSIVDGHFGVLSRWLSEGEATRNIYTIEDLIGFFQEKTNQNHINSKTPIINFDIYSRTQHGKLYASTLSTLIDIDYMEVNYKMKTVKDSRKTKYAPKKQILNMDVPDVVGVKSKQVLETRIRLSQRYLQN